MKKSIMILCGMLVVGSAFAEWKAVEGQIMTPWGEKLSPENVLPEYPRPIMERPDWKNLNGLWDYAITPVSATYSKADGQILVPFAVESALSGVCKKFTKDDALWYSRDFDVAADWKSDGKRTLLHFGAVDWKCDVWVNGVKVGAHTGGYAPFSFDITDALKDGKNALLVRVVDPTDGDVQPRGKQVMEPKGCFYTAVSGIWQTVWLESVPSEYISKIRTTPDFDRSRLLFEVSSAAPDAQFQVVVSDGGKEVGRGVAKVGETAEVALAAPKAWSPDSPFLYDVEVSLVKGGKTLDSVKSYAALRKISQEISGHKHKGFRKMLLNNKAFYSFGPLDQGWWPDGLYTPPSDAALKFDVEKTKQWGFNTIRKHIKIEPARWYYHCDKIGILVWQDMPSGEITSKMNAAPWIFRTFMNVSDADWANDKRKALHMAEWEEIMDELYSYPCIGVWVPFNERWGQFDTRAVVDFTKKKDPTRLVNAASGGNHYIGCGDILDSHHYPEPQINVYIRDQINVIGEYGGIGCRIPENSWKMNKSWGYVEFKTNAEVTDRYVEYVDMLKDLVPFGVVGAIYTQATDVEGEINGIMTYDRKVVKLDEEKLRKANLSLIETLK